MFGITTLKMSVYPQTKITKSTQKCSIIIFCNFAQINRQIFVLSLLHNITFVHIYVSSTVVVTHPMRRFY